MKSFRVDLRSDTVTRPSDAMRKAMAELRELDDRMLKDIGLSRGQIESLFR